MDRYALTARTPAEGEFAVRLRPKTPKINWRHAEGWILVGGEAVDRGFTVDSLSVTYMPRGTGVGNADTLQQRARFFGYKHRYLGICRIYLEEGLKTAFEQYVEHEELMRLEIKRLAERGTNLRSWRRRLVLDPSLQPCRRSVISDSYLRATPGGGWTHQLGALMTQEKHTENTAVLEKLIQQLNFERDTTCLSTSSVQIHEVDQNAPLKQVVDALVDYQLEDPRDTAAFTGLLVSLGEVLKKDPSATAAVYWMRPPWRGSRAIGKGGTIDNFVQGPTRTARGVTTYPGDSSFKAPKKLSLQLHSLDLRMGKNGQGPTVAKNAPLIAFHVPARLAKAWLVQIQSEQ